MNSKFKEKRGIKIKFFVLVLNFILLLPCYAQLAGTYTVGGSSPNFTTLDSAFSYMKRYGVTGKVRLNIRSGTQVLRSAVTTISGVSATNTIQVSPDPKNTSAVILKNKNTSSTTNFLLKISQSYLRFDSLTFILDSSSSHSNIVVFDYQCNNITFNYCNFYGKDTLSQASTQAIFSSPTYQVDYLKITNCKFYDGSMSLELSHGNYNEFRNNQFTRFYHSAMFCNSEIYMTVEGNYVMDGNKYQSAYGFYLNKCDYLKINNNKIFLGPQSATGIYFASSNANSTNPSLISNNFISNYDSTKNGSFCGLNLTGCSYVGVYYNTIVNVNKSASSKAANILEGFSVSNARILNNIFYSRFGYALYLGSDIRGIKKSDNNLLYTGGTNIGYYGSNITSLSNLQKNTLLDSNSINKNLVFKGLTDLHTYTIDLYKKGVAIPSVVYDIDNVLRKTPLTDIGAHEQKLPTLDVRMLDILNNLCEGVSDVYIKFQNSGNQKIDSCEIKWKVSVNNGTFTSQTPIKIKCSLISGRDTTIKLGTYNFTRGDIFTLDVRIDNPNNKKDSLYFNDSLVKLMPIKLKGEYSIGGASPNFTSIKKAFDALNKNGVCGPVRLILRSGTYTENIIIGNIAGTSSVNTVRLVSDPKNITRPHVVYSYTLYDNYVFSFMNASYIKIDSISMSSVNGRVIVFNGKNSNISFNADSIAGPYTQISDTTKAVISDQIGLGNSTSNLSITNCIIQNGTYGIYLNSNNPYSKVGNILISGNKIRDFSYQGINSYYHYNVNILNNIIIDNNGTVGPTGIRLEDDNNVLVKGNKVYIGGIINPFGISFYNSIGVDTQKAVFANNAISMYNPSSNGRVTGVNLSNSKYIRFIHNTVNIAGGDSTSVTCYLNFGGNYELFNNNLSNYGVGCVYETNNINVSADNNNLFAKGKYVANFGSTKFKILSDLNKAYNVDKLSVSTNPNFVGLKDLHSRRAELNGNALYFSEFGVDLDNNIRNKKAPDIGAYELTPYKKDLELVAINYDDVKKDCNRDSAKMALVLLNNGLDTIRNFNIYTELKNVKAPTQTQSYWYTKNLLSGKRDTFILNKFEVDYGGIFEYKISHDFKDTITNNDSLSGKTVYYIPVPFKLKSKTDTICDNGAYSLSLTHQPSSYLKWYDAPIGGKLISQSDTLKIKNILKDSTIYVTSTLDHTVPGWYINSTNNNNMNCSGGIMFDLKPKRDLVIDSFTAIFTNKGPQNVYVYIKKGTYSGFESDSGKWKIMDTIAANPLGVSGVFYPILLKRGIRLDKDSVYGVYLRYDARFQTGSGTNTNADVSLVMGSSLCSSFGGVSTGRLFNGQVFYSYPSFCETSRVKYELKVKKAPNITLGNDTAYCEQSGIDITLNPGNGFKFYKWSVGDTTQQLKIKNGGLYSVVVTANNNCTDYAEKLIVKNPNPSIYLGPDLNICANTAINVLLSPGAGSFKSYLWSNGTKNKNLKATAAGLYSIIVTNSFNCNSYDTVQINKINLPVIDIGQDTFYCSNDGLKLSLNPGQGYSHYYWSNGDTTQMIMVSIKGKYLVTVEDQYGCKGKDSITIIEKMSPIIYLVRDTFYCHGNNFQIWLDAGSGMKDYLWSTSDKSSSILVNNKGVYSVIVTANNGCLGFDTTNVLEVLPPLNLGRDTGYCAGKSFNYVLDAGPNNFSYMWSTLEKSQTINISKKGQYSVLVKDQKGCENSDTILVSEINTKIKLGNDTSFCSNNGVDINLDAGPDFIKYAWIDGQSTRTVEAKKEGYYGVIATGLFGCTGTDSIFISKINNPVINLGQDLVLNPNIPINVTLDAGSGYASYLWNTNETSQTIQVANEGVYSVIAKNSDGCAGEDSIRVRYWNETNIKGMKINSIKVFPNPANDRLHIASDLFDISRIQVFTTAGKELLSFYNQSNEFYLETNNWIEGVYIISCTVNAEVYQIKLVVCHN